MLLFPAPDEPALAPDRTSGLGRAIVGGAGAVPRRKNDFYPTPDEATLALLGMEGGFMRAHGGRVWEPCGRGGAITRLLLANGFDVVASDVVADPAHDVVQQDLLLCDAAMAGVVMTNPPFALASKMIAHLLGRLGVTYLALLLKATFWAAEKRGGLLARYPVAMRYDLNWRLDFTDGGSPTMECSWFVWDQLRPEKMRWAVLERPAVGASLFQQEQQQ